MTFRKIQPPINPVNKISCIEPELFHLDNKIPVYFIKSDENILKIKIIFNAGCYFQSKPLAAVFASKLLSEGSKNYTQKKIAEFFDYYGAKFSVSNSKDHAFITLLMAKKNFEKLVEVMADIVLQPIYAEKEFKTHKAISLQNFNISNEKVSEIARKVFCEKIFGNSNFYGYNTKASDFENINTDIIKDFYSNYYTLNNCIIILTGNFQKNETDILNRYFGQKFTAKKPIVVKPLKISESKPTNEHIIKKGALQTGIRVGKVLFNRTHPDDMGFRVLNMILGGYFGSRLMNNIREDKGYTYGIYSTLTSLKQAGYFSVITDVGAPFYKQTLEEVNKEIVKLQQEKVGDAELELVKNYILGSLLRQIDGPLNYSNLIEQLILMGLNTTYLDKYINEIQNISSERIQILAQKYLNTDTLCHITVG